MSRISEHYLGDQYPDVPGWKRTETSREAAAAIAPNAEILRERIYQAIKAAGDRGMTADEAAAAIRSTPLASRPRITELRAMEKVKPSLINKRRPSSTGRSSLVWVVT